MLSSKSVSKMIGKLFAKKCDKASMSSLQQIESSAAHERQQMPEGYSPPEVDGCGISGKDLKNLMAYLKAKGPDSNA